MAASYRQVSSSQIEEYIANMRCMLNGTEGRPGHERFRERVKENLQAAEAELRKRQRAE